MLRLAFDIETDNLLDQVTKVHSLVVRDVDNGDVWSCHNGDDANNLIEQGLMVLDSADVLIGHNVINFDLPALRKVLGWTPPPHTKIVDTLVLSRLMYSDIKDSDWAALRKNPKFIPSNMVGRHGLEAWGYRLGELKGEYGKTTDWAEWTPQLQAYCEQDVVVTTKLFHHLTAKNYSQTAIDLELDFAKIIWQQTEHGFKFNEAKAVVLQQRLVKRKEELTRMLQEAFEPTVTEMKMPEYWVCALGKRYRTKGEAKTAKAGVVLRGPNRRRIESFNPGSRDEIAERLRRLGWKPVKLTDTGKAVVSEEELEEVAKSLGIPQATLIAEYLTVQKRLGQIAEGDKSWLKLVRKGRIHGEVITNGAVTGRCTHKNPNVTQTPAASKDVPYGYECRECWEADEGFVLVGADASGLELRCLGHYMALYDGGEYAREVVSGDVHTRNQKAAGLATRAQAKVWVYAYLYGAGNQKLGIQAGVTDEEIVLLKSSEKKRWQAAVRWLQEEDQTITDKACAIIVKGDVLRHKFEAGTPALKMLKAAITLKVQQPTPRSMWKIEEARRTLMMAGHTPPKYAGHLTGVDGRILRVRSAHSALNTLLQSAGAIAVKMATVIHRRKLKERGLVYGEDFANVAHVHDEIQCQCRPEHAQLVGQLFVESIKEAGEALGFRCPLSGEFKVGQNWAQTH